MKLLAVLVATFLVGCGGTTSNPAQGGTSGAAVTGGGGAVVSQGGASSQGGVPSQGGAPSQGGVPSNGGASSGGAPALGGGCTGDLPGKWAAEGEADPVQPEVDACWNLTGSFVDGIYRASARYPRPKHRRLLLTFSEDTFAMGQVLEGEVSLEFAPPCLVTEQGSPTCAQLESTLLLSGQGEGSVRAVSCTERAGGGCVCVHEISEVGGKAGSWKADAGVVTFTTPQFDPQPAPITTPYCVSPGQGLRFGAGSDQLFPGMSQELFTAVDCQDEVKGPGEEDVDCGGLCEFTCL